MAQTGNHKGLTFGIFLAPFHRVGENPTLSLAREIRPEIIRTDAVSVGCRVRLRDPAGYVPIDISPAALADSTRALAATYPLDRARDAVAEMLGGHAGGKIVLTP